MDERIASLGHSLATIICVGRKNSLRGETVQRPRPSDRCTAELLVKPYSLLNTPFCDYE
jgi:hypothetical protein